MLTENETRMVQTLSLLIFGILMFLGSLTYFIGKDFNVFIDIEAIVMYLNYMYYEWRSWSRP